MGLSCVMVFEILLYSNKSRPMPTARMISVILSVVISLKGLGELKGYINYLQGYSCVCLGLIFPLDHNALFTGLV